MVPRVGGWAGGGNVGGPRDTAPHYSPPTPPPPRPPGPLVPLPLWLAGNKTAMQSPLPSSPPIHLPICNPHFVVNEWEMQSACACVGERVCVCVFVCVCPPHTPSSTSTAVLFIREATPRSPRERRRVVGSERPPLRPCLHRTSSLVPICRNVLLAYLAGLHPDEQG